MRELILTWTTENEIGFITRLIKRNDKLVDKYKNSDVFTSGSNFIKGYVRSLSLRKRWDDIDENKVRNYLRGRGYAN